MCIRDSVKDYLGRASVRYALYGRVSIAYPRVSIAYPGVSIAYPRVPKHFHGNSFATRDFVKPTLHPHANPIKSFMKHFQLKTIGNSMENQANPTHSPGGGVRIGPRTAHIYKGLPGQGECAVCFIWGIVYCLL